MARNRLVSGFADFFGDIARARQASSIYNDLSGLSDEGLKARGLTRSDLSNYAFNKAFGSK